MGGRAVRTAASITRLVSERLSWTLRVALEGLENCDHPLTITIRGAISAEFRAFGPPRDDCDHMELTRLWANCGQK